MHFIQFLFDHVNLLQHQLNQISAACLLVKSQRQNIFSQNKIRGPCGKSSISVEIERNNFCYPQQNISFE